MVTMGKVSHSIKSGQRRIHLCMHGHLGLKNTVPTTTTFQMNRNKNIVSVCYTLKGICCMYAKTQDKLKNFMQFIQKKISSQ